MIALNKPHLKNKTRERGESVACKEAILIDHRPVLVQFLDDDTLVSLDAHRLS